MPRNGEINQVFGVYKNLCCGAEIVIPENVTFPLCATHANLPTEWKNITLAERIPHVNELFGKKKKQNSDERNPAA
jgi:hypothetical protein